VKRNGTFKRPLRERKSNYVSYYDWNKNDNDIQIRIAHSTIAMTYPLFNNLDTIVPGNLFHFLIVAINIDWRIAITPTKFFEPLGLLQNTFFEIVIALTERHTRRAHSEQQRIDDFIGTVVSQITLGAQICVVAFLIFNMPRPSYCTQTESSHTSNATTQASVQFLHTLEANSRILGTTKRAQQDFHIHRIVSLLQLKAHQGTFFIKETDNIAGSHPGIPYCQGSFNILSQIVVLEATLFFNVGLVILQRWVLFVMICQDYIVHGGQVQREPFQVISKDLTLNGVNSTCGSEEELCRCNNMQELLRCGFVDKKQHHIKKNKYENRKNLKSSKSVSLILAYLCVFSGHHCRVAYRNEATDS